MKRQVEAPRRISPPAITLQIVSTAFAVLLNSKLLHAEEETLAQRRACEPDVFKLCKGFIPDRTAITGCLVRNKPHLSTDCRAVFDGKPR